MEDYIIFKPSIIITNTSSEELREIKEIQDYEFKRNIFRRINK
jgi:hypothetical protein